MPHMSAFLPCRFTLHGLLLKQDTVPHTALCPVAHLWFPGPGEDSLNKDAKFFTVLSLFYHFFVSRQKHPSNVKRAQQDSARHVKLYLDVAENACASPQEARAWLESPFLPLRKKYHGSPRAWVPSSAWGMWAAGFHCSLQAASGMALLGHPGALQLIPCDSDQEQRLQESTETERSRQTGEQPPGMPQGGISELPPSQPLCPPISFPPEHLMDPPARRGGSQDLLFAPFSSKIFAWDLHGQKERKLIACVACVRCCSVEEKVESHKGADVQEWEGIGDPELNHRGQRQWHSVCDSQRTVKLRKRKRKTVKEKQWRTRT